MALAQQEFTNAGRSMLGRAQAGETLTITKIVLGSGSASAPSDLWPLTALITYQMDVTISSKLDYGQGTLLVEGSFLANAAPHLFALREVGIMAHIGSEADRLYSVSNVFSDPPDTIDPASPILQAFKIKLIIDRIPSANLIIQIGPTEAVTGQNLALATDGPGVYKSAAGNVLSFKRLKAGPNISITEDTGQTLITIGAKLLTVNTDLYVPASHPLCPDPSVGFPTVQAAHDYLLQFRIPANVTATIHIYSGTFTTTSQIDINHPDAAQINIFGEPLVTKNVSSVVYVDSTHKNVTVDNTTGLVVGQRVHLAQQANDIGWGGGCKITAIAGNVVTCSVLRQGSRPPYSTAATGGRLSYFPTVLVLNISRPTAISTHQSCLNCRNGIGIIKNICTDGGDGSITIQPFGKLQGVSLWNSYRGLNCVGLVQADIGYDLCVTDCDTGVSCSPGSQVFLSGFTYVVGCGIGFDVESDSTATLGNAYGGLESSVCFVNNCQYGVEVSLNANMRGGALVYSSCDIGIWALYGGVVWMGFNAPSYNINNGYDLQASAHGFIDYKIHGGYSVTSNPAANTIANALSYINVYA